MLWGGKRSAIMKKRKVVLSMALQETIYKLRNSAHMSREKLAVALEVSQQAVAKWESGLSQT